MDKYPRSRPGSRGIVVLALIAIVITLAVCGCLSESKGSGSVANTTMSKEYTQSGGTDVKSSQNFAASNNDVNAVKVADGGTFTLSDSKVTKTGDTSSNENSDFYGLNTAVLAQSGSTIKLANCTVTTNANGQMESLLQVLSLQLSCRMSGL